MAIPWITAGRSAQALSFDTADRVYYEDFGDAGIPTSPEEDTIGAGGLVGGGTHAPSVTCGGLPTTCRLNLDSALASSGTANSFVEMAPGSLTTSSFGVRTVLDDFFMSTGADSIGRARVAAEFDSVSAAVELVWNRQGGDVWQLALTTSAGASAVIDLPGELATTLSGTTVFRLDLYVDRTGHWVVGGLIVDGHPEITTASLNFFTGTEPLSAVRLEGALETNTGTPSLNLESVGFNVYQPSSLPLPQGFLVRDIQQIHNDAGYLTDPGSPGTDSGSDVLGDLDRFGLGSTSPGDLDGDGTPDLIVGAPDSSGDANLHVLFLNADGTVKAHQRISNGAGGLPFGVSQNGNGLGSDLHWLGALGGGGSSFLAAGAPDQIESGTSGSVFMLQLATDGTVSAVHRIADGLGGLPTSSLGGLDQFGASVSSPGDLNADGVPELAVGAPLDDHGGSTSDGGAVWILFLDSSGTVKASPAPVRIASTSSGIAAGDRFGAGVAGLGDLDGAGPSAGAIAVGSPGDGGEGSVTLLFLDATGGVLSDTTIDSASGDLPVGNPVAGANFGEHLARIDDLDGDGRRELAVGAPNTVPPPSFGATQGELWLLFLDAAGGVGRTELLPVSGGMLDSQVASSDGFGFPGSIGDLDGNGLGELVVGAPWDRNSGSIFGDREGAVYVLFIDDVSCGDGRASTAHGEQCDDGNATPGDGCSDVCIAEFCGDHLVTAGLGETCDDGNALAGDGCSNTCILEFCGDGVVQSGLGETCDDGNTTSEDGCSAVCIAEFCGDDVVQSGLGETCDDGNATSEDGCSAVCIAEFCGDTVVQSGLGETCDDGNATSEDGCSAVCIAEFCGDGFVQAGLGETCDDGNGTGFDGCSATCQPETVLQVVGTASGGTLDYTIGGETISLAISAGQTASQIADALAAAINGNATLAGQGITATTNGDVLVHGGAPAGLAGLEPDVALATSMASVLSGLSAIPRVLDFERVVSGDPVPAASTLEGVTFGYSLGEIALATNRYATPSAENGLGLDTGDDAFFDGDSLTFDLPRPVLAFGLYVVTSDPAEAGEIQLTTPQGTTGNTAAPQWTTADGGYVYFLAHAAAQPFTQAVLAFANDGATNFVYTLDDLTAAVPTNDTCGFVGTAAGGYVVGAVVDGVSVQITTTAGQTAAQVAQALADAINADPTLQALGTAAAPDGNQLLTNGTITNQTNDDPGLVAALPALGPHALGLLAALLLVGGVLRTSIRRRS